MKYKLILLFLILLALGVTSAYAGSENRIGTAGGQELRIPVGARGIAMGGSNRASVSGVESIFWNPAGLASLEGGEAMFMHMPYIADIDVNFLGVAYATETGRFALSAKIVNIGEIEETTQLFPDGTGRIFDPTFLVLGFTYARDLTAHVSFGITANLIHESIFEVSATGMSFDAGFIYRSPWRGFSLGMVVKDYGPTMRFNGPGFNNELSGLPDHQMSAEGAAFDLPSSLNLGVAYNLVDEGPNLAIVTGNFKSNNFSQDLFQGGAEYVYDGIFALRAGYNYSNQDEYLYGISAGFGLNFNLGETKLSFDYAWQETEFFDDNQFFTAKASF